ncbi:hypothetical protein PFISCL1PPCAC_20299, partial [Pristionchus fissidentatus]
SKMADSSSEESIVPPKIESLQASIDMKNRENRDLREIVDYLLPKTTMTLTPSTPSEQFLICDFPNEIIVKILPYIHSSPLFLN